MILVSRDEILPRFDGISVVLKILHKLYLAITCKKFYPDKTRSPLYCQDPAFPGRTIPMKWVSARLSGMKQLINTSV